MKKIEGVIFNKRAVKDNDVIISVLLRSGQRVSIYCHGGQSARRGKASLLELGFMNSYVTSGSPDKTLRLMEISSIWQHKNIRYSYELLSALSFICELIDQVTVQHCEDVRGDKQLFNYCSNAYYYLDQIDINKRFNILFLFLVKLMLQQGIFPALSNCMLSQEKLSTERPIILSAEHGGFVTHDALSRIIDNRAIALNDDRALLLLLREYVVGSFKEASSLSLTYSSYLYQILLFYCYQIGIDLKKFKTLSLIKDQAFLGSQ